MSYPKSNYKKLDAIRNVLKESSQFPEAMCDCAARIIYEELPYMTIMNGFFQGTPHVWTYDMKNNVHIDITLDQFQNPNHSDNHFEPISILTTQQAIKMGYELGSLKDWNQLFKDDFLSLKKQLSRNKTVGNVMRTLKRKSQHKSRFKFW
jgi:hypothetical protein